MGVLFNFKIQASIIGHFLYLNVVTFHMISETVNNVLIHHKSFNLLNVPPIP